ncbi:MAG: flavodoxin-dependent (E)-4-hydroxy-3-methylbut-2-enyl-diphosphate synthase [Firmicutes bacterium]|nr:flavodoxin-dependent (E)-4-hydroxy-3-methylbut-2-enyl-diphosphate synthase [Bacillota bacterium]
MERTKTKKIYVGNIQMGGNNRVSIQSMTNTKTKNVDETIKQIQALEAAGCEIVRVAVLDMEDAKAISKIKKLIHLPLVADIHFDYRLALEAIRQGVDKIRINPGNIGNEERIREVVLACKEKHIPIRIGVNSGSLEKHILDKYGHPTAEAMVESARYHVEILEKLDFHDIVISLKSTDMMMTVDAYRLASNEFPYPLHLGITEAGTTFSGTIRSSIGLGILLSEGIGSTIRVSLTADPVDEIKVAKEILQNFGLYKKPRLISCPTCGRIEYDMIPIAREIEEFLEGIDKDLTVAIMGCAVNGPGEAKEANIAIAGGKKEALLYIDGIIVKKVKQEDLVSTLKKAVLEYQKP